MTMAFVSRALRAYFSLEVLSKDRQMHLYVVRYSPVPDEDNQGHTIA